MDTTTPTWGYKPDGSADIFDLASGEGLPEGWHASPDCIVDPALATAEALSARAEGRPAEIVTAVPSDDVDDEIDRLRTIIANGMAENERLAAELDAADAARDAALAHAETARTAHAHTMEQLETAASDLAALNTALTAAQADGGFAVAERDEANARIAALAADLAQAKADIEALTAPVAPTKTAGKAR